MFLLTQLRRAGAVAFGTVLLFGAVSAFQKPFRVYPGFEYTNFPIPKDYQEKTEWAFARLMYPPVSPRYGGAEFLGSWKQGQSNWTMDYPRSDRHLSAAVRRLTRVHTRSVEQPVDLDEGDQFDWPWLYGVEVGHWELTDDQAKAMREYLLRGGFFYADDFWGPDEWRGFEVGMKKIFPNREIVELPNEEALFHTVYDLDDRYQILGEWGLRRGPRQGGITPQWMGVRDDKGRLMVAITANSDIGDSWEFADLPTYPERFSALGIRIGVDYVIYSMTH